MRKRHLLALLAAAPLAACGFRLRGMPQLPFRTLYIQGEAAEPLVQELRETVLRTAPAVALLSEAGQRDQADAVLVLLPTQRERAIVGLTAAGQVRELQLRLRQRFALLGQGGREWIADTELRQSRDVSYSETVALAKEEEEALLFRDMQTDLVQQLLRRLAMAKPR